MLPKGNISILYLAYWSYFKYHPHKKLYSNGIYIDRWMISPAQEPDWQMLGRCSPCLLPPFSGSFQRGRCARYMMETSLLNLPVFVYLSLRGVYLILRAVHELTRCLPHLASDELVFEAPSFVTYNLITVPFNLLYFPKLARNP